ncbi:MAG: hypothetical protein CM15mP28_2520 [Pseudomonadota bacterium]|nr:MAG: hypothetical protein CM15mP28_2520 [Pseudomonadota bacterium]
MERDMPEELLYEGKAKKLFITEDPQILRVEYKDDATAFNGKKFDRLRDKGRLNNAITVFLRTPRNKRHSESFCSQDFRNRAVGPKGKNHPPGSGGPQCGGRIS